MEELTLIEFVDKVDKLLKDEFPELRRTDVTLVDIRQAIILGNRQTSVDTIGWLKRILQLK